MAHTKSDVARLLGVSLLTVSRYIRAGLLVASKAPGRNGIVTIEPDDLDAFRRAQRDMRAQTYDTESVARTLLCHPRTVQRLVSSGVLKTVTTPGRAHRITRVSVNNYRDILTARTRADRARAAGVVSPEALAAAHRG